MRTLSRTLSAMKEYDQAIDFAQTSLQTAVELLGETHSFSKTCRKNLADIHRARGDIASAETLLISIED